MKKIFCLLLCFSFFLLKTAFSQPTLVAEKTIGGTADDQPRHIIQTADGGALITGRSKSVDGDFVTNRGDFDLVLIKIKADMSIEWAKNYGGTAFDGGFRARQTADGGYVVIGSSNSSTWDVPGNKGASDVWVLRVDASGTIVWSKTFGGSEDDFGLDIHVVSDGFLCSATAASLDGDVENPHGGNDAWILKLDANGTLLWQKTFGGSGSDRGWAVIPSPDGSFAIGGDTNSEDGDIPYLVGENDATIAQFDASGNISWVNQFGGTAADETRFIARTPGDGIVCVGSTLSNDGFVEGYHDSGAWDYWLFKVAVDGTFEWGRAWGGTGNDYTRFQYAAPDGSFIGGGVCDSQDGDITNPQGGGDVWLAKMNAVGDSVWQISLGGSGSDDVYGLCPATGGGYFVVAATNSTDGQISFNHGGQDIWLAKLSAEPVGTATPQAEFPFDVQPTLAADQIFLKGKKLPGKQGKISIVNAKGQVVFSRETTFQDGQLLENVDVSRFAEGAYFINLQVGNSRLTRRFVKN